MLPSWIRTQTRVVEEQRMCFLKVNLKEAAESADDSDDLNDFIADFGEQCGIGSSGGSIRERSDETCVTAFIQTPVRVVSISKQETWTFRT